MKRSKGYSRVWFSVPAMQKIIAEFQATVKNPGETKFHTLTIERKNETWNYDTVEEFLTQLRHEASYARFWVENPELNLTISMRLPDEYLQTDVEIASSTRENILRLANVVDACADDCFTPPPPKAEILPPKPKIFIGHGGSPQWRDVKDHLHEQHGYEVVSYETGSRAGHTIRDVIQEMLESSSFAILVMTAEDRMEDGTVRARQNVIHETGLFQGRLGFSKAVILKEEGTEEFSNIHGVTQIRYAKDNIKETFGEVLAVLRREFGERR